jgi:hypothetical protein
MRRPLAATGLVGASVVRFILNRYRRRFHRTVSALTKQQHIMQEDLINRRRRGSPCDDGLLQLLEVAELATLLLYGRPQRRASISFQPFPDGSRKAASTLP